MNEETTHECADCDRLIPVRVPRCIYCKGKKKKAGLCWWCGTEPTKSARSSYCVDCQNRACEVLEENSHAQGNYKTRSPDVRENVHETKHGIDR